MAEPDAAGLKARFPQFASFADADVELWLEEFPNRWNTARFGTQYVMAAYLFACHYLTIYDPTAAAGTDQSAATGNVTSEKVGDLARSYGASFDISKVPGSLMPYTRTSYGIELIGIVMSRHRGAATWIRVGTANTDTRTR